MISLTTPMSLQEIHNHLNSHFIEFADSSQCLRKYHIQKKSLQAYKKRLQATFTAGYQSLNRNGFLQIGNWFAEIYYFDPFYSQTFSFIQEQFLSKTMANIIYSNQKQAVGLYIELAAKLVQNDQIQILLIDTQMLSSNVTANSQVILKKLAVIECSIRRQILCKGIFLKTKSSQVDSRIQHIFKHFQENYELNHEKVIMGKIRVISACLSYFLSGYCYNQKYLLRDQRLTLKEIILEQIWKCEASIPLFQENQDEILELIKNSVELYGVYDEVKLSQLLSKNEHKIENSLFLQIFKLFLDKTSKVKGPTNQILNLLLTKALDSIFQLRGTNFSQTFMVIKLISDIIIRSFSFCTFNFTKQITYRLKILREDYHRKFLTTLLLIYNSKLQKQLMNNIIPDLQKVFYHNQCFLPYEKMMNSFGSINFNIIDYAQDPQKKDEALLWELLTLRNAIKVDYKSLSQNNYVFGIYRNLLKFILCNIFWSQCSKIVFEIFSYKQQITQNNLGDLNIPELIQQVLNIDIPCLGALNCFLQVLCAHKQIFLAGQFICLSLFNALCELIELVIDKNGTNKQLTKIAVQLLKVSLPEKFQSIPSQTLYKAHHSLLAIMFKDLSKQYFHLYLDLIYLCMSHTGVQAKLIKDKRIVQYVSTNQEIQPFSLDKFEILDYMIHKNGFQLHIIDKIWENIKIAIESKEKDIFLYFIQIFYYFNSMLEANARNDSNQRSLYFMFLKDQTLKIITIIDQIYKEIAQTFLVQHFTTLLQMAQAFQIGLYKNLVEIEKYDQIRLTNSFYDLPKETSNWFKKLEEYQQFQCFKEDNPIVKKLWNCCYLSLMLIASLSYRMCQSSFDCYSFSYETMRQKLNHAKAVIEFSQKSDKLESQYMLQFDKILTQQCRFVVSDSRFTLKL